MSLYSQHVPAEDCKNVVDSCINRLRAISSASDLSQEDITSLKTLTTHLKKNNSNDVKKESNKNNAYNPPSSIIACPFNDGSFHYKELVEHLGSTVCRRTFDSPPEKTPFTFTWRNEIKCDTCKTVYTEYSNFDEHCKDRHANQPVSIFCNVCQLIFPLGLVFYDHHRKTLFHERHHNKLCQDMLKPFTFAIRIFQFRCWLCKINLKIERFSQHVFHHHRNTDLKTMLVWCQGCDCIMTAASVQKHIEGERHKEIPWFPIMCILCGTECVGGANFKHHLDNACSKIQAYRFDALNTRLLLDEKAKLISSALKAAHPFFDNEIYSPSNISKRLLAARSENSSTAPSTAATKPIPKVRSSLTPPIQTAVIHSTNNPTVGYSTMSSNTASSFIPSPLSATPAQPPIRITSPASAFGGPVGTASHPVTSTPRNATPVASSTNNLNKQATPSFMPSSSTTPAQPPIRITLPASTLRGPVATASQPVISAPRNATPAASSSNNLNRPSYPTTASAGVFKPNVNPSKPEPPPKVNPIKKKDNCVIH